MNVWQVRKVTEGKTRQKNNLRKHKLIMARSGKDRVRYGMVRNAKEGKGKTKSQSDEKQGK